MELNQVIDILVDILYEFEEDLREHEDHARNDVPYFKERCEELDKKIEALQEALNKLKKEQATSRT